MRCKNNDVLHKLQQDAIDRECILNGEHINRSHFEDGITEEHFYPVFQPIISIHGRVKCFEMLMRWNRRIGNEYISPDVFFSVAEKVGSSFLLWKHSLSLCARFLEELNRTRNEGIQVTINTSPNEMHREDFYDCLFEFMKEKDLDPASVILEITENDIDLNDHALIETIGRIRNSGIEFAIDDFGVGRSSIARLSMFDVKYIKIDKSLLYASAKNGKGRDMLNAIVHLCKSAGTDVVIEGVETQQQMINSIRANCDAMQGYFFSPPMVEQDAMSWLEHERANVQKLVMKAPVDRSDEDFFMDLDLDEVSRALKAHESHER